MRATVDAILAPAPCFALAWASAVAEDSGRVALIDARDGSAFTLGELDGLLRRTVSWLRALDLRPGDRLLVAAPAEIEVLLVLGAAQLLGVVPVVLHPNAPPARVTEMAAAAAVRGQVDARTLEALADALPSLPLAEDLPVPDADADAVILFSSGSTGPAKGVRLSHRALAVGVARVRQTAAIRPGDRTGLPFLPHTITGFRLSLGAPAADRTTTVLLPPDGSPAELLAWCAAYDVAVFHTVPAFVRACLHAPERLRPLAPPSLRRIMAGGGALSEDERRAFATGMGIPVVHSYGATEIGGTCAAAITRPDGTGEAGMGHPLVPMEVLDVTGAPCAPGVEGWISVSPEAPMSGFLGGGGPTSRNGRLWVETGDLGILDADGRLFVRGRAARTHVAPSGEKVLLDDLERVLRAQLGIDVVAASLQLPRRGAALGVLVARETASARWKGQARAALGEVLPAVAVPTIWHAVPVLPKLPSGKTDLEGARLILEAMA